MSSFKLRALFRRICLTVALVVAGVGLPLAVSAQSPILVVHDTKGQVHSFTSEAIAALPWTQIRTHTRWTEGQQVFRGPLLSEIYAATGMTRADLDGRVLVMTALNDFKIELPAVDAWEYNPILAREMNGEIMSVRQKGPLWVVYPRDDFPALQGSNYDDRWIWQLREIFVR